MAVEISDDEQFASLTSGDLTVRFHKGDQWKLDFVADGRVLTSSGYKNLAALDVDGEGSFMREQLLLGVGDTVYGLGERFGPFAKNGRSSTSGRRTAAPAASRRTRTSRST